MPRCTLYPRPNFSGLVNESPASARGRPAQRGPTKDRWPHNAPATFPHAYRNIRRRHARVAPSIVQRRWRRRTHTHGASAQLPKHSIANRNGWWQHPHLTTIYPPHAPRSIRACGRCFETLLAAVGRMGHRMGPPHGPATAASRRAAVPGVLELQVVVDDKEEE